MTSSQSGRCLPGYGYRSYHRHLGFQYCDSGALFSSITSRFIPDRWLSLLASILGVAFYTLWLRRGFGRASRHHGESQPVGHPDRPASGRLNALVFHRAVMCAFNPGPALGCHFQLSFSATLGLVWFGVPLEDFSRQWLAARLPSQHRPPYRRTVERILSADTGGAGHNLACHPLPFSASFH